MPFDSIEQAKKNHPGLGKYSDKAQRGWLKSINQCFADGGDDGKCFPIAYSVANKVDGKKASAMRRGQFIREDLGMVKERMGAKDDAMTPEESARRQKKVKAIRNLAENLGRLKTRVNKDLGSDNEKDQLTALVVWIMDRTAERVGNEESAKAGHVGVTGLKCKNVTVDGNTVKLNYVGKSGVDHEKDFTDKRVAPMIKTLIDRCEKPGDPIFVTSDGFKIKADRVNRYLKDMGVKSKDIRGFAANRFMEQTLKRTEKPSDEAERKKVFLNALKTVSERVGHTAETLRRHYLLPDVEDAYIKRGRVLSPTTASSRTSSTTRIDRNVDIDIDGDKVKVEASVWFTGADYDDFIKSMAITVRKIKAAISELADSFDLDMIGYKLFADKGRVKIIGLLRGNSPIDRSMATLVEKRASVKFFVLSELSK